MPMPRGSGEILVYSMCLIHICQQKKSLGLLSPSSHHRPRAAAGTVRHNSQPAVVVEEEVK